MDFIKEIYTLDENTSQVIQDIIYDTNNYLSVRNMPLYFIVSLCHRAQLANVEEKEYISLVDNILRVEDKGLWKDFSTKNVYCDKNFCKLEYQLFKNMVEYLTLRENILNEEKENNILKRKFEDMS